MRRLERGFGLALNLLASFGASAQPPTRPILPERLVGRWSDSGDCAKYVVFRSDGHPAAQLAYARATASPIASRGRWFPHKSGACNPAKPASEASTLRRQSIVRLSA